MPSINGTLVLKPERVVIAALVLIAMSYGVFAQALFTAEGLNLQAGPPVGGDFVAFWAAARAMMDGLASQIYQPAVFETYLLENAMERERFGLTWQYPPTYYFFIAPLAFLPFLPAYAIWSAGSMAMFLYVLHRLFRLDAVALLLVFACPIVFNTVITGQNGFITASLLFLAAALPDKRPIIAGIAAGFLTVKPQLGVLLPIAFIAAGCWRAFFSAAFTTSAIAALSLGIFGYEAWEAFVHSILNVGGGVKAAVYPIHKMPTVFAALHKSGVPSDIAMGMQILSLLIAFSLVGIFWRHIKAWDLRAAILCSAVFLCSPYAYYYEMTILLLPIIVLVKRAAESQWLQAEEIGLALICAGPLFLPGVSTFSGAQLGLCVVIGLLFFSVRRALYDTGFDARLSEIFRKPAQI